MRHLTTPLKEKDIIDLQMGEEVLVSGVIYTARDMAHKRMYEALLRGEELPLDLSGQILYYTGPSPSPPNRVIGSAGPTTSNRMDDYTGLLLAQGLKGMLGKGNRAEDVVKAIIKHRAIYLATIGGAGAYLAKRIKASSIIAYAELGTEAIRRLEVEDLPAVVAIDVRGNNIYKDF